MVLDDNAINQVPRPGTSLRSAITTAGGTSQAFRPTTNSGRPMSGVVRPGSQSGRPGTMDAALKAPRTARTARPVSSSSGRYVRLGTASMLSHKDGPFINLARLNIGKYTKKPNLAKALFEYIFYHENSVREALDLAAQALQASNYEDWYWKFQVGKCYYRFGMFRDAEKMFKSALKQQEMIDVFLHLARVYLRIDQPMAALEVYRTGLDKFPNEISLLTGVARIYEAIGNLPLSAKYYKVILKDDAINVEAIACIGMNHFYADQPELSLRFYRRLLQMGINNAELFNNIGLCCFYSQQYDLTLACMERALSLADEETIGESTGTHEKSNINFFIFFVFDNVAEVWYNIGHIGIAVGDPGLAYQCFRLTLTKNNNHAEAFNNLGILELRKGNVDQARAFFQTAGGLAPHLFEPNYNLASVAQRTGDLQTSYVVIQKALKNFPEHKDSLQLLEVLRKHFSLL
ncbi:tetratricopeptide repeat protein 8-like isoform X3 [Tigriopus californicus]|nr:tetratricopeptide repeat protein 8-like isoform X3 [Tigriopus californicus]